MEQREPDFLDELATMLPEDKREAYVTALAALSPEERAAENERAKQYYAVLRNNRNHQHYRQAVSMAQAQKRAGYADRKPEGAAATRRRKQLERRK